MLDENQDVTKREVGLALTAGQQVMFSGSQPPRADGGQLWRWRTRPWVMIGFSYRGDKKKTMSIDLSKTEKRMDKEIHWYEEMQTGRFSNA